MEQVSGLEIYRHLLFLFGREVRGRLQKQFDDGTWYCRMYITGIIYLNNGARYDGDFIEGIMEGKGTYYYANGDKYEGDWGKNKKHGQGKQ
jgi:hypothetical protein